MVQTLKSSVPAVQNGLDGATCRNEQGDIVTIVKIYDHRGQETAFCANGAHITVTRTTAEAGCVRPIGNKQLRGGDGQPWYDAKHAKVMRLIRELEEAIILLDE